MYRLPARQQQTRSRQQPTPLDHGSTHSLCARSANVPANEIAFVQIRREIRIILSVNVITIFTVSANVALACDIYSKSYFIEFFFSTKLEYTPQTAANIRSDPPNNANITQQKIEEKDNLLDETTTSLRI